MRCSGRPIAVDYHGPASAEAEQPKSVHRMDAKGHN